MKNVLLTTTALVAFAGAAAADVSLSAGADFGYNDDINGEMFYDVNIDVAGAFDLGDGYGASISYGFDLESKALSTAGTDTGTTIPAAWGEGHSGLQSDAFPTIEITAPFGSLKGGDLGDKGASEYFYADRDGMTRDVENHDSSTSFDVRALAEFGAFGVAVGAQNLDDGTNSGLNIGAGGTFGDITVGLGYDDDKNGVASTAVSADWAAGALTVGVSYIKSEGVSTTHKLETAPQDDGAGTMSDDTVSASIATATAYDETSLGLAVGYAVNAELTVGASYANNSEAGDAFGVSATYTSGPLSATAYYESLAAIGNVGGVDLDLDGRYTSAPTEAIIETEEWGIDVSYEVSADLTGYAGYFDDGTGVSYVGVVYAINDSLSATVSYAEADEISGPEFKAGTTVMLSASF